MSREVFAAVAARRRLAVAVVVVVVYCRIVQLLLLLQRCRCRQCRRKLVLRASGPAKRSSEERALHSAPHTPATAAAAAAAAAWWRNLATRMLDVTT